MIFVKFVGYVFTTLLTGEGSRRKKKNEAPGEEGYSPFHDAVRARQVSIFLYRWPRSPTIVWILSLSRTALQLLLKFQSMSRHCAIGKVNAHNYGSLRHPSAEKWKKSVLSLCCRLIFFPEKSTIAIRLLRFRILRRGICDPSTFEQHFLREELGGSTEGEGVMWLHVHRQLGSNNHRLWSLTSHVISEKSDGKSNGERKKMDTKIKTLRSAPHAWEMLDNFPLFEEEE